MKKIILSVFVLLTAFASCTNEDYLLYDTSEINHISFTSDTTYFAYGFNPDLDVEVEVSYDLFGMPALVEGEIMDIAVSYGEGTTATEGVEFDFVRCAEMTDSTDVIAINIHKDALVTNQVYTIVLNLEPNECFDTTAVTTHTIRFINGDLTEPGWWKDSYVGTYTVEKHLMIVQKFWETEELSPTYHYYVSYYYGENLDLTYVNSLGYDMTSYLLSSTYKLFMNKYCLRPVYDYYIETGDENYAIPDPY